MQNVLSTPRTDGIKTALQTWLKEHGYKAITTIEQLKAAASVEGGCEVFILLAGGMVRSSKQIATGCCPKFHVWNLSDDSRQRLSEEQLMDESRTNIGKAMKMGALYLEAV